MIMPENAFTALRYRIRSIIFTVARTAMVLRAFVKTSTQSHNPVVLQCINLILFSFDGGGE